MPPLAQPIPALTGMAACAPPGAARARKPAAAAAQIVAFIIVLLSFVTTKGQAAGPPHGFTARAAPTRGRMTHAPRGPLFEVDRPFDPVRQADVADGQHHLRLEPGLALELAGLRGGAHRPLDLALRGDPDDLEKLAQRGIQSLFVHRALPRYVWRGRHHRVPAPASKAPQAPPTSRRLPLTRSVPPL